MADFKSRLRALAAARNGNNGDEGDETPGVKARRAQLKAAALDVDPAAEAGAEYGRGTLGGSAAEPAHAQLRQAKSALNRQLRVQAGKPLYRGSEYIGDQPVEDNDK